MKQQLFPILTCEHASNAVPTEFAAYLPNDQELLNSHRGWDIGAKSLCKALAEKLKCDAFYGEVTRLLIDINRTVLRQHAFSNYIKAAPVAIRKQLVHQYHQPFREAVKKQLDQLNQILPHNAIILHISVHSFTPELNGKIRTNDIGLLYDPKRVAETAFAKAWRRVLHADHPLGMRVQMNYPYLGTSDGHTRALRTQFTDQRYIGIELEVNQKHCIHGQFPPELIKYLINSLLQVTEHFELN